MNRKGKVDIIFPIGNGCPNFPISLEVANKVFNESGSKPILDLFSLYLRPYQGNEIPTNLEKFFFKKSLSDKYLEKLDFPVIFNNKNKFDSAKYYIQAINKLQEVRRKFPKLDLIEISRIIDPICKEGVESTLRSRYRTLGYEEINKNIIKKYIISWLISFFYIKDKYKFGDFIFHIWNGRFCKMSAVQAAARDLKIKVYYFELSNSLEGFMHLGYDFCEKEKRAIDWVESYKNATELEIKYVEKELNLRTKKKLNTASYKFINDDFEDKVPDSKFILIVPSSEDEYASLTSWHGFSEDWHDAISFVKEFAKLEMKINVIVRIHPNMARKNKKLTEKWLNHTWPKNFKIISPYDKVNTYSLIKNAILVIGDASTVMLESAFLKAPIRFFNSWWLDNYYEELNIRNSRELENLLNTKKFMVPKRTLKDIYRISFIGMYKERISFKMTKLETAFKCSFYNDKPQKLHPIFELLRSILISNRKRKLKITNF